MTQSFAAAGRPALKATFNGSMKGTKGALAGLLMLGLALGGCGVIRPDPDAWGTVEVEIVQPVAARRPALLKLTLHNTGRKDLTYRSGGPLGAPSAMELQARVQTAGQPDRDLEISNCRAMMAGASTTYRLAPGAAVEMPAALGPLEPGRHRVVLEGTRWTLTVPAIELVVPDDSAMVERYDAELLRQIRARSSFAG